MKPNESFPNRFSRLKYLLGAVWALGIFLGLPVSQGQAKETVAEKPPLYLVLGEQRLLKIPELKRFSLGGPSVRAQPLPLGLFQPTPKVTERKSGRKNSDLLLLKAVQAGPSDLWVWKSDGSAEHRMIQVARASSDILPPALERALEKLNEIEVYISGAQVVLRGKIRTEPEAARIQALAQGFPKRVHDETEPTDDLLDSMQAKLESWLKHSPYSKRLELDRRDKSLVLELVEGSIESPAELARIEKHARAIDPLVEFSLNALPDDSPTVHFKVYLLELKKSRFHSLGLSWPAAQAGAFVVTTSGIQDMLKLELTLQILEGEGSVRILSNPELVVRAPGDAELFSGGEIPIQSQSAYFSAITWKKFGLLLQLHVIQSAGDRVRLDITTEVSHLDPTLSNNKLPGLQSNRMKTEVDARYGHPLLLSGLLQQSMHEQAKGLPFLRRIPILGALFGSKDYLNEKSELVAILVPSRELPQDPMERITRLLPRGPIPPSRIPPNPELEHRLKQSPDYPWNVLR